MGGEVKDYLLERIVAEYRLEDAEDVAWSVVNEEEREGVVHTAINVFLPSPSALFYGFMAEVCDAEVWVAVDGERGPELWESAAHSRDVLDTGHRGDVRIGPLCRGHHTIALVVIGRVYRCELRVSRFWGRSSFLSVDRGRTSDE